MIHGGDALAFAREKKIDVGEVLDFSANINPYGIHPTIVRALQEEITHLVHYPDVRYQRLREDIAKKVKVQPQEVFLANGLPLYTGDGKTCAYPFTCTFLFRI